MGILKRKAIKEFQTESLNKLSEKNFNEFYKEIC